MKIKFVDRPDVHLWWPHAHKFLKMGLETSENEVTLEQLYELINSGHTQLIMYFNDDLEVAGAMTCNFISLPNMRVLHVSALSGYRVIDQRSLWNEFKNECVKHGVHSIRAACKPAQARLWRRFGFNTIYQQIEVKLTGR